MVTPMEILDTAVKRIQYEERNEGLPPLRQEEWKTADELLNNSFEEAANAEAKLLLLGEEQCQSLLREYVGEVSKFAYEAFLPGSVSKAQVDEFKATFLKHRKAFFAGLSAIYKRT